MGSKKSIMRSLGEFVGHISKAVKTPAPRDSETHELRRETDEREATGPDGRRLTLRRTTIEEIEVHGSGSEAGPEADHEPDPGGDPGAHAGRSG